MTYKYSIKRLSNPEYFGVFADKTPVFLYQSSGILSIYATIVPLIPLKYEEECKGFVWSGKVRRLRCMLRSNNTDLDRRYWCSRNTQRVVNISVGDYIASISSSHLYARYLEYISTLV